MAFFDRLNPVSFSGYAFPVRSLTLKCSLRHHAHEYPYAPGAALEGLGRKLYEVRVVGVFHETFPRWPKLLETAATLRTLFEGGQPWDLNIPHVGIMSARCIEWQDDLVSKARSGYDSAFTFIEDQSQQFLADKLVTTSVEVGSVVNDLLVEIATRDDDAVLLNLDTIAKQEALAAEASQFESLLKIAAEIEGYSSGDIYSATVAQKAENAAAFCSTIARTAPSLNEWPSHRLLNALSEVHASMRKLARDAMKREAPVGTFVTPIRMAVGTIAARLYGDTTRAVELLRLNAFDDALDIPAQTPVRHYTNGLKRAA